jgi:gamma-glutamylcyclotransferase
VADLVWGVLFDFDASEKHLLDQAEGLGHGYDEFTAAVEAEDGRQDEALLYIAASSHIDNTRQPYSWYKRFVIEGARHHGIPKDYIDFLNSFQAREDPHHTRDERERAITC